MIHLHSHCGGKIERAKTSYILESVLFSKSAMTPGNLWKHLEVVIST